MYRYYRKIMKQDKVLLPKTLPKTLPKLKREKGIYDSKTSKRPFNEKIEKLN